MVEETMAFERWQQQLCNLIIAVHKKQHNYDRACEACQLLLKPWPKKSKENEDEKKGSVVVKENENLTDPQDEAELKLLNEMLTKAQRTRMKTSLKRQEEEDRVSHEKRVQPSHRGGAELLEDNQSESMENCQTGLYPSAQQTELTESAGTGVRNNVHPQNSAQSVRKKHVHNAASGSGDDSGRSKTNISTAVSNPRKPTMAAAGDSKRSKGIESAQSAVQSARPKSGAGRVKPAHVKAPFKTDPNIRMPKRQAKKSSAQSLGQSQSLKNHIHSGNSNKVLPPISSDRSFSSPPVTGAEKECFDNGCDTPSSDVIMRGESKKTGVYDQEANGEYMNSKLSDLTLKDPYEQIDEGQVEALKRGSEDPKLMVEQKPDAKQFCLLTDGSAINIPSKVRRAYAKNQQLRSKVSKREKRARSKPPAYTGKEFADKLEQLFDTEEELLYRQQALQCLCTHQQLADILQRLDLDLVSVSSTPYEILRAKMTAEFVLSSFSAYTDSAKLLSKVQFPEDTPVVEPLLEGKCCHLLWQLDQTQGQDQCFLNLDNKICYTKQSELDLFTSLVLKIQMLQCQLRMLHILIGDVLPWLQEKDPREDNFSVIFKGMFSLMVADGKCHPALVRDTSAI